MLEPPLHALALVGREAVWAVGPPLAIHHPQAALRRELALLAVQRTAIHAQASADLVLAGQAECLSCTAARGRPARSAS